jgi:hypothetical protein
VAAAVAAATCIHSLMVCVLLQACANCCCCGWPNGGEVGAAACRPVKYVQLPHAFADSEAPRAATKALAICSELEFAADAAPTVLLLCCCLSLLVPHKSLLYQTASMCLIRPTSRHCHPELDF